MTALTVADVERAGGFLSTTPCVRHCDVPWCDNPERGHTLHMAAWSVVDRSRSPWGSILGYVYRYQDMHGDRAVRAFVCTADALKLCTLDSVLDQWWKPVVDRAIEWKDARP